MKYTNIKTLLFCIATIFLIQGCGIQQSPIGNNDQGSGTNQQKTMDPLNRPGHIVLEGYGEVIQTHIPYRKHDEYDGIEMYKRPNDLNVIEGIERYGAYRLFSQRPFEDSVNHHSEPKIEFLALDNEIKKIVYPLNEVSLFNEANFTYKLKDSTNTNQFLAEVNPKDYFDSIAFQNEFYGGNTILDLQYDLQQGNLIVKYTYFVFDDTELFGSGFEIIVYDNIGTELGQIKGSGVPNGVSLSNNKKYLYISTGGQITEDSYEKTSFTLVELSSNKEQFKRLADSTECIQGFYSKPFGYLGISSSCDIGHEFDELYLIDDQRREILEFKFDQLCPKGSTLSIYKDQFFCYNKEDVLLENSNIEKKFNPYRKF